MLLLDITVRDTHYNYGFTRVWIIVAAQRAEQGVTVIISTS